MPAGRDAGRDGQLRPGKEQQWRQLGLGRLSAGRAEWDTILPGSGALFELSRGCVRWAAGLTLQLGSGAGLSSVNRGRKIPSQLWTKVLEGAKAASHVPRSHVAWRGRTTIPAPFRTLCGSIPACSQCAEVWGQVSQLQVGLGSFSARALGQTAPGRGRAAVSHDSSCSEELALPHRSQHQPSTTCFHA